jgi:hypothetical protein
MGRRDTTTIAPREHLLSQLEMKPTCIPLWEDRQDNAPRELFSHLIIRRRNVQQHRLLLL